jgi:hypothetical protein
VAPTGGERKLVRRRSLRSRKKKVRYEKEETIKRTNQKKEGRGWRRDRRWWTQLARPSHRSLCSRRTLVIKKKNQ